MTWGHNSNRNKQTIASWTLSGILIIAFWLALFGAYKTGYYQATKQLRSSDMNELITLSQVMQDFPSSIVVVDCKQFKMTAHKLRKQDTIYGECK